MKNILYRFMACLVLVCLTAAPGLCGDMEELKDIALELKSAIERRDRDGVMKYIKGYTCFHEDCYDRDQIAEMLKDDTSDPSEMLFFGEFSLRTLLLKNPNVFLRVLPEQSFPGSWQIMWLNPENPGFLRVCCFLERSPSGWRVTTFLVG